MEIKRHREPIVVHLLLTNRCNLNCIHCCNDSGPTEPLGICLDTCRSLAASCKTAGIHELYFTGGEVTLRPDLLDCLEVFCAVGLKPGVFTNGVSVSTQLLAGMLHLVKGFSVSIDGPPDFHDRLRSRAGAFEATASFINRVREAGGHTFVQCTVTRSNLDRLEWAADWAQNEGLSRLDFAPLQPAGRANHMPDRDRLSLRDLHRLFDKIAMLKGTHPELGIGLKGMCDTMFVREHPCNIYACSGACHDGKSSFPRDIVIMSDGTVYPLVSDLHPFFRIGNINEQSLDVILDRFEVGEKYPLLLELCKHVATMVASYPYPLFPWLDSLAAASRDPSFWNLIDRTMPVESDVDVCAVGPSPVVT